MHFHFWVPKGTTPAQVREAVNKARDSRDVVSASWDFIPDLTMSTTGGESSAVSYV